MTKDLTGQIDALLALGTLVAEIETLRAAVAALTAERDEYYADMTHFHALAFVDVGANPPVAWRDCAEAAGAEIGGLRQKLAACQGPGRGAEGSGAAEPKPS